MKRIFLLILTVLLFPALLAMPARADELSNTGWINVLDFSTLNGSGSNIYYLYPGNTSFYFDLPNIQSLSYVDMIFTGSYDMSHIQVNNGTETSNLTVVYIGGNLYRAFGYIGTQWTGRLNFLFPEVNRDYHITVLQLEVTAVSLETYDSHLVGDVQCGINHYNINSGQQSVYLTPYENDYDFKATLVPYEWYKFDYVKVYIDVDSYGIHSISVDQSGIPVPFEVSYLGPSSTENKYRFCVTIDTRHLDRVSTNNVDLRVFGRMDSDGSYFSILSVTGYVVVEEPSELRHWFTTLIDQFGGWFSEQFNTLSNGFNGTISSVASWGQNLKDSIDALPDKIAEALKEVMVPSDSAIQNFGESSQQIAQDRFGGVYQGAMIVDEFAGQLKAQAATQILAVPVVNLNILGIPFPLGGWEVDLVPEGSELIIEAVKLMIDIVATLAFINGIKSRLERTLEQ